MNPRTKRLLWTVLVLAAPTVRAQARPDQPPTGQAEAEITLLVPADAEITFDGAPTKSTGTKRVFTTPLLEIGKVLHYDVVVRWKVDGKPVEQTRRIPVRGGAKLEFVFGDAKPPKNESKGVARNESETGVLLRREAAGKPWQIVAAKEALRSGDLLLGIDAGASIVSNNNAVRLAHRGEFNGDSPYPILETAVILHDSSDVDLDVTLERGRIYLTNTKEKGAARVRVHVRDKAAELVLTEPGASVAIEIYGRWPRGVQFTKNPKPEDVPALAIVLLVVKGEVELKGKGHHLVLKAPPGQAMLMGDGVEEFDAKPVYLDKLPDWAIEGKETERGRKVKALLGRFRKQVLAKGIGEALDEMLKSEDEMERRGAVILMGALDDLPRLGQALLNAKHPDVWDAAVLTVRQWIGRGPGQDLKLYRGLIETRGYKPAEAEGLMQLLHSFGDEELARPELYEVLINYLESEKLAIRGLAHWHLVRLAPAGKKIAYDPLAPKEKRDLAIAEWRKLIPSGKLPPEDK